MFADANRAPPKATANVGARRASPKCRRMKKGENGLAQSGVGKSRKCLTRAASDARTQPIVIWGHRCSYLRFSYHARPFPIWNVITLLFEALKCVCVFTIGPIMFECFHRCGTAINIHFLTSHFFYNI